MTAKDCTTFALMDIHCTNKEHFILKKIARSSQMLGMPCYVIGGFVRDKLIHRKTKDIDIICVGDGVVLAHIVAKQFTPTPAVAFFKNFGTALVLYYLQAIIVILFMLLLIVPGIIRAIAYAMSYYILADQPHLGPMEVLNESKRMMDGYKMKYFRMMLRFFGLSLLCILTLGIGYLWLFPYMQVTMAKFYDDLKKERGEEEFI